MRSEWKNVRLCDTPIDIIDGDRGKNYPNGSDFSSSGYCLFLNAKNVTASGFSFEQTAFISKEKDELLRKGKLKRKDVVLTTRGTVGNVAYYDDKVDLKNLRINSGMVILRSDCGIVDSTYMYWLFRSPIIQEQIAQIRTGSAQPQLPISIMRNLEFMLPSFPDQKAIAAVLSALDDKIELNKRINHKLEEMAQAIFKSWFVDFEPWGGEMPFDWHQGVLSEMASSIYSGGTPSTGTMAFWGGGIPWLSSGETRNHFIITTDKSITQSGVDNSSTRLAHRFDVVMASAGQGFTRGQTSLLLFDSYVNQSVIVMSTQSPLYLFLNLSRRYEELRAISDSSSIRGSINTKMLAQFPITVPSKAALDEFSSIILPLITQIENNLHESACHTMLRDTLLPKLMSGELVVEVSATLNNSL